MSELGFRGEASRIVEWRSWAANLEQQRQRGSFRQLETGGYRFSVSNLANPRPYRPNYLCWEVKVRRTDEKQRRRGGEEG